MMDSQSSTRYWLEDENGQLTCEATVVASFKVPRWVPVPLNVVQNAGQASVRTPDADQHTHAGARRSQHKLRPTLKKHLRIFF